MNYPTPLQTDVLSHCSSHQEKHVIRCDKKQGKSHTAQVRADLCRRVHILLTNTSLFKWYHH